MNNKRTINTILSLVLAFAMTFAPIFCSYTAVAAAIVNDEGQVTATQEEASNDEAATEDSAAAEEESAEATVVPEDNAESDASAPADAEVQESQEEDTQPVDPTEEQETDAIEEEAPSRTEYVWKDSKVKVTAKLTDPEAVPDDAELVVTAIDSSSDGYNYDAYMEALNKDSGSDYDDSNTLLYDVAFIKDGTELQPESGKVAVTFEFLDNQLEDYLGAGNAKDVNVIHLPLSDNVKEKYDTTADATKIDAGDIRVEELTKSGNGLSVSVDGEKAAFSTDSFSVFAYTVDFEYSDPATGKTYTYNLEGEGSITIRELAVILGIVTEDKADEFVKNIENVEFTDDSLVKVQNKLIGGWTLKSLAPFSSNETLTITMKDGSVIVVNVTDVQESSDLTNFLKNAVISGASQNADGAYEVEQGKEYSIVL